jgi:hypothetical protein
MIHTSYTLVVLAAVARLALLLPPLLPPLGQLVQEKPLLLLIEHPPSVHIYVSLLSFVFGVDFLYAASHFQLQVIQYLTWPFRTPLQAGEGLVLLDLVGYAYVVGCSVVSRLFASGAQQYYVVFLLPRKHLMVDGVGVMVFVFQHAAAIARDRGCMEQGQ